MTARRSSILHILVLIALCFAFLTILFGAATTSTNSGMAFPDWPTSDGRWLYGYPWSELALSSQAFFEHHHRELAGFTGICCVVLWFLFLFWVKDKGLKVLMNYVMVGIIVQGGLGAITVKYKLERETFSVLHAVLGQALVVFLGLLSVMTSKSWLTSDKNRVRFEDKIFYYLPWVLVIQLFLGALYRHKGEVVYLLGHGLFACVAAFACAYAIITVFHQCRENKAMLRIAKILTVLLLLQLSLGTMVLVQRMDNGTVSFEKVAPLGAQKKWRAPHARSLTATGHVFVGAMMLMMAASLRIQAKGPFEPKT